MIGQNSDRILMSDSLKGMIPELEEATKYSDHFVVATLMLEVANEQRTLVGSMHGVSLGEDVKIDLRSTIEDSFFFVKLFSEGTQITCKNIQLTLGDHSFDRSNILRVSSVKMIEIDHQNKMCTLALDLIEK